MKIFTQKHTVFPFALLLFISLSIIQFILIQNPGFEFNYGAEFGRVAESIYYGKGYGNVWGGNTGPTATVPPVLVFLHLLGLVLFDNLLYSFLFIQVLKFGSFGLSFYFIYSVLRHHQYWSNIYGLFFLFYLFIFLSFTTNFHFTGDLWINTLLFSSHLFVFSNFLKNPSTQNLVFLSLICFLAPLVNSAIALAIITSIGLFFIIEIIKISRSQSSPGLFGFFSGLYKIKKLRPLFLQGIILGLAFSVSVGVWTARNYLVFQEFIPSKSNMWLEFYLANIVDEDGRLSYSSNLKKHPVNNPEIRDEISIVGGEIAWFNQFKEKGKRYLKNNKEEYFRKVGNRVINAFLFSKNDMNIAETSFLRNLDAPTKNLLIESKLVTGDNWINLEMEKEECIRTISALSLNSKEEVFNDWYAASQNYFLKQKEPFQIFRGLLLALIPTLILFFLLFIKRYRENPIYYSIFVMYVIYLVPYILVSHQLRYQRPLMVLQIILIVMFADFLISKLRVSKNIANLFSKQD